MNDHRKVWFVFPTLNRYQSARYRAYLKVNPDAGVIEVSGVGSYDLPKWRSPRVQELANVVTLFRDRPYGVISTKELRRRLWQELDVRSSDIGVLAVLGWGNREANCAHAWALSHRVPCVLLTDTHAQDRRRSSMVEWLKGYIVREFDGALAAGNVHADYLVGLGFSRERIMLGYNVVDNAHFAEGAAEARLRSREHRRRLALPTGYFFCPCRLIWEKNLPTLLRAYKRYQAIAQEAMTALPEQNQAEAWRLVLMGDGPEKAQIGTLIGELGLANSVLLLDAKTYEELPTYYALASALILASVSETWGLVVNEGMACGLPVLVSRRCGCCQELVKEGENGFSFEPTNVEEIARLMLHMSSECDLDHFGRASERIISQWSLNLFVENISRVVCIAKRVSAERTRSCIAKALLWKLAHS